MNELYSRPDTTPCGNVFLLTPRPQPHQERLCPFRWIFVGALIVSYTIAIDLISSSGRLNLAMCHIEPDARARVEFFLAKPVTERIKRPSEFQTTWRTREA